MQLEYLISHKTKVPLPVGESWAVQKASMVKWTSRLMISQDLSAKQMNGLIRFPVCLLQMAIKGSYFAF